MRTKILTESFYARDTVTVARRLLGKIIRRGACAGRIVEVEAYLGGHDLAAHSARGLTDRTRVIFGPPGRAYVYLIYGMHQCLNLVAERDGAPGCVLIRALQPLAGMEQMRLRRPAARRVEDLCSGPGKLTRALDIGRELNGTNVTMAGGELTVEDAPEVAAITTSARIGITKCADWPLRLYETGSRFVSRG